jgi:hypothetical protein
LLRLARAVAKLTVLIAVIAITAYLSHWLTLGGEANCETSSENENWSPSQAYKATVLKKECGLGETAFYSVRIDAVYPSERMRWFIIQNLETNTWPDKALPPQMVWNNPQELEITIDTPALSGRLVQKMHDGLTVIRLFNATPKSFPHN